MNLQSIAQTWVSDGKEIRPVNPHPGFLNGYSSRIKKGDVLWTDIEKQHTYATDLEKGTYNVSELKEAEKEYFLYDKWRNFKRAGVTEEFIKGLPTRLFITKKEQEVKQQEETVEQLSESYADSIWSHLSHDNPNKSKIYNAAKDDFIAGYEERNSEVESLQSQITDLINKLKEREEENGKCSHKKILYGLGTYMCELCDTVLQESEILKIKRMNHKYVKYPNGLIKECHTPDLWLENVDKSIYKDEFLTFYDEYPDSSPSHKTKEIEG